jgi:hypothetical protein
MKAQFLKLAGVKTEKEFYKKFPTEEAFMAKYGAKLKKGQFGINLGTTINPNLMKTPDFNGMLQGQAQTNYMQDIADVYDSNPNLKNLNYKSIGNLPVFGAKNQVLKGEKISDYVTKDVAEDVVEKTPFDWAGAGGAAAGLVQGIQAIGDQKDAYKNTKMNRKVSDVALQASRIKPEQIQRRYNRPEDYSITGEELFPVYGKGSNVLAKNGKKMYQTGGPMPFGEMLTSGGGDALSGLAMGAFNNNAGYQLGAGIGKAASFIPGVGPIAGAIAAPVLGTIGGVLDNAFGTAGKMKKEQAKLDRNINNMMYNSIGQAVSGSRKASMAYGGKMAMGGDLQVMEGTAQPISQNHHIPGGGETVMFNGPSHANGGIPVNYNGNMVEVEGGEPATQLPDSQTGEPVVTVFGNLKIPKSFAEQVDPLAKNKKFKNYAKELSILENKQNKIVANSSKKLDGLDPNDTFDRITRDTLEHNIKGANMKLAEIAEKKMAASELQEAINKTSEMYNLDPNALVKGDLKPLSRTNKGKAKAGATLMAEDGVTTDPKKEKEKIFYSEAEAKKQGFKKDSKGVWVKKTKDGTKETVKVIPGSASKTSSQREWVGGKTWQQAYADRAPEYKDLSFEEFKKVAQEYIDNYKKENVEIETTTPETTEIIPGTDPEFEYAKVLSPEYTPVEYKRNPMVDAFNQVLPFIRPSNGEPLDAKQLYGEMFAMATNQLEPVPTQSYQPLLDVPYDISLQDQVNEVTASSRSASQLAGYNPAFQANIAAQEQMNKSKILGEQFRLNQAMKDRVYAGNRATLNDASLKNIALYDQQYQRQAQALSNTKETSQLALNSISDKYLKNDLNNRNLQLMENMYNYRFDRRGRAINMNPLFQPNIPQVGAMAGQDLIPIEDEQGNIVRYQLAPTKTTTKQDLEKAGKTNDYVARNGSLVRSLKML